MILLLGLMDATAGERERGGMRKEAFRGNCKIMVVHYVTMTGCPRKLCLGKTQAEISQTFLWTPGVNIT